MFYQINFIPPFTVNKCNFKVLHLFSLNSKNSLRNALRLTGITELTDTQSRILKEGRSHYNAFVQGRPNDGQTVGLVILMLQLIDATKDSTQAIIVSATRDAAVRTLKEADKLAQAMGQAIRCGLAHHDAPASDMPTNCQFHCIVGTPQALTKCIGDDWFGLRIIAFDDGNKSMSYNNKLLSYGAKYVCVSAFVNKKLLDRCNSELNMLQLTRAANTILSKQLRHIEFMCASQFEKLTACIQFCNRLRRT